jgi:hypothetical protein
MSIDITDDQRKALLASLSSSQETRNEIRIAMHSNKKPHANLAPATDFEGEKRFKPIFVVITYPETKTFLKFASATHAGELTDIPYYKWRDAARLGSKFKHDGGTYQCYFRSTIPTEYSEETFVAQ